MSAEEFPSFQKKEKLTTQPEKTWASVLVVIGVLLGTALIIFFGFRFLVGAKTPREEMLGRVMSASPSRQSSLLMEWMQNIDHSMNSSDWKPSAIEQVELLRFSVTKIPELKTAGTSPGLYALHVAGWGPSLGESKDLETLTSSSLGEEGTLALGLFFLRQKDFSSRATDYLQAFVFSQSEASRKVAAAYFSQCVQNSEMAVETCKQPILKLLSDINDEVRWNASLGILRAPSMRYSDSEKELAAQELSKLYALIKNSDPALFTRFQATALESLATEVFRARMVLLPEETKLELKELSSSHKDLRIRNIARLLIAEQK